MTPDRDARARFQALLSTEDVPLAEAALAVAAEEYPSLDTGKYLARLDEIAARVRTHAPAPVRAGTILMAVRNVLFEEERFRGNDEDYYDPRNSFLNEVLDRRLGIPITLSLLYMEVARRVGLRLQGVAFPGHFLLKYAPQGGPEVFIDPYNGGEVLSSDECVARFKAASHGRPLDPRHLAGVGPKQILARLLHNLKRIYLERADDIRLWWVVDRLLQLDPDQPEELRDRGLISARLGAAAAASKDLTAYLDIASDSPDAAQVREVLETVRTRNPMMN
ncbi:MAG: transglutaminase-like domain-containing protein [Anaeromyxobacteraceae bacterium]